MQDTAHPEPITVFVLSWERPLYLWVTLDSLYRHTRHPVRFILCDNHSQDPLVRQVVRGFERRGLFYAVELFPENLLGNFQRAVEKYGAILGDYFGVVEADVEVLPGEPCWLTTMVSIMDRHPKLQFLGSLVDHADFVSVEDARRLAPGLDDEQLLALVKAFSPEKEFVQGAPGQELETAYKPPGRLNLYRTAVLPKIPLMADGPFSDAVRAMGDEVGVALKVRHRHLSLLNLYDYPEYDMAARDDFFAPPEPR